MTSLQDGQTFINGRDPETARRLLAAAEELGHDPSLVVLTTSFGYIVPDEVADAIATPDSAETF